MIRGGIVTLNVSDVGRAVRFYVETLGLKLTAEAADEVVIDAGDGFRIALRVGPTPTSAVLTLETKVPLSEATSIYENRGVSFTTETRGARTVARFVDPDGNVLCLAQGA